MVRPLGAYERALHLWMHQNPMHFSVVAELDAAVSQERCRAALAEVQRSHPLLRVGVTAGDGGEGGPGPVFHRSDAPVPLTVVEEAVTWQAAAAGELARPFARGVAPLVRAALVPGERSCVLVLTFEHSIADGLSAVGVLGDVLAVLNGRALPVRAVPAAQEDLVAALTGPAAQDPAPAPTPEVTGVDARMGAVSSRRPFDGALPHVSGVAFDAVSTRRLLARCRTEGTTVHAAICAAATQVAARLQGLDFVRVASPVSLRHLIDGHGSGDGSGGVGGNVALRIVAARTGFPADPARPLWDLARDTGAALAPARSAGGVAAVLDAIAAVVPAGADAATAEAVLLGGSSFEVQVTNLGVLDLEDAGPLRASAVWGPVLLTQIADEQVIGVATHAGQLRLTGSSYVLVPGLLEEVRRALADAVA